MNLSSYLHRRIRQVCTLLCSAVALVTLPAPAQNNVDPSDYYQREELSFDRAAPASDHYLWTRKMHGYSDTNFNYRQMLFVCLSSSDPKNGACPTSNSGNAGISSISLRFTERRSRLSQVLVVRGYMERYFTNSGCFTTGWGTRQHHLTSNNHQVCGDQISPRGSASTIWIPQSELARLPSGGVWTAQLRLKLKTYASQPIGAANTYTVDFKLDVTDHNNMQIYLPAYGVSTPLVDLNLRTRPLSNGPGGIVSGQTVVDACLYDGYNANSQRYEIRVTGTNPVPGMDGRFFVHHASGGIGERNRIEYKVRTRTANLGETQHVSGQPVSFTGINNADIRAVRLPNVPFPVVCTPWPITLQTPAFNQIDKNTGQYRGELKLEFTPSTSSP
ncbi:CfaE/CblD family pilus tip adhesin [Pseudomonas sp. RL_105y_Pfl2_101]|uniref:CfaE/CblD family pilus tip adhesin n=1 Tax=Pseudomonas sp. RL_105y_Pfl2_101 TaxID=3088708 RepID=UPI0030D76DBE